MIAIAHRRENLYEKHAQIVYRYLFSLTGEMDTAEELTQDTFYQALKSIDTYRGESTPQVWLCAIAKRLWFKELKRRKRLVSIDENAMSNLAAPDDPEKELERQDEKIELYRAMQQLAPETQEVIRLRLTGEFSFRDIGDILGRSEVWARVRFYRGKEELVRIMGGDKNERK